MPHFVRRDECEFLEWQVHQKPYFVGNGPRCISVRLVGASKVRAWNSCIRGVNGWRWRAVAIEGSGYNGRVRSAQPKYVRTGYLQIYTDALDDVTCLFAKARIRFVESDFFVAKAFKNPIPVIDLNLTQIQILPYFPDVYVIVAARSCHSFRLQEPPCAARCSPALPFR